MSSVRRIVRSRVLICPRRSLNNAGQSLPDDTWHTNKHSKYNTSVSCIYIIQWWIRNTGVPLCTCKYLCVPAGTSVSIHNYLKQSVCKTRGHQCSRWWCGTFREASCHVNLANQLSPLEHCFHIRPIFCLKYFGYQRGQWRDKSYSALLEAAQLDKLSWTSTATIYMTTYTCTLVLTNNRKISNMKLSSSSSSLSQ